MVAFMAAPDLFRLLQGVAALGLLASAGGPARAEAPGYLPVNHQRVAPRPPAEVWDRVHAFLQDEGFAVTSENVRDGIIDASRASPGRAGLTGLADCNAHLFFRTAQVRTELTILIKPAYDGTKVTVNTAYFEVGKTTRKGARSFSCTGDGGLENAVLDAASGQPMEAAVIPR